MEPRHYYDRRLSLLHGQTTVALKDSDLLWGQLNPDRLLYNLYEELSRQRLKELEGQK